MGQRIFYRIVLALLLIAFWGTAKSASAQDLYSLAGAGDISSHNITHAHAHRVGGLDGISGAVKLDDAIAQKLAPGNALYVIPTIGIGTYSASPAILFEGRF